jgi:hypothetical protein
MKLSPFLSAPLRRRDFLRMATGAAATAAFNFTPQLWPVQAQNATPRMIGIQVGAVSFFDERVEQVLDIFQEKGAVNTLFLTTFTYGRGLAGRQIPGQPFPDHGVQQSDESTFHGGNYASPHPEFYRNTALKETRAPDHGDRDVLAAVLPAPKSVA